VNTTYTENIIVLSQCSNWNIFCWIKVEQLLIERAAERKEVELLRSRVEKLQEEQKRNHETIGQVSAQRDELKLSCNQHSDDLNALQKVGNSFVL